MKWTWAWVFVTACSGNADVPAPKISSVFPDHGQMGEQVMIEGSAFCQQPDEATDEDPSACANTGTVVFDQQPAEVLAYSDTSIMVTVPVIAAGSVRIVVQVAGRTSDGAGFVVTP